MRNKPEKREQVYSPKRCPKKHVRAYKTAFGKLYCPDCGHNIES